MKAQLEVSFNWIFVLFAGAAILFVFWQVIDFETTSTERGVDMTVGARMGSIFESFQVSPDSTQIHRQFNHLLTFSCDEVGIHSYTVGGSGFGHELTHDLLFTPREVGNSRLISWTRDFNTGFKVATVSYLTDFNTHYVFSQDTERFYNNMPGNLTKTLLTDSSDFTDTGHRNYVAVRTNAENDFFNGLDVDFNEVVLNTNTLTIDGEEFNYHGDAMVYGAIISGNPDIFKCVSNKIIERTNVMAKIYSEKASVLNEISQNENYITMKNHLNYLSSFEDFNGNFRTAVNGIVINNNNLISGGRRAVY